MARIAHVIGLVGLVAGCARPCRGSAPSVGHPPPHPPDDAATDAPADAAPTSPAHQPPLDTSPKAWKRTFLREQEREHLAQLGIDRSRYPYPFFVDGAVKSVVDRTLTTIRETDVLAEPGYSYFLDERGDLVRERAGEPWSPPAIDALGLSLAPLPALSADPATADVRFAVLPIAGVRWYESELLTPERAFRAWRAAHARAAQTGLAPIVRPVRIRVTDLESIRERAHTVAAELAAAERIDLRALLHTREADLTRDGYLDDVAGERAQLAAVADADLAPAPRRPYQLESTRQYVVLDLFSCPSWAALAWIGFGGWNDAPPTVEQVAYFRHWHETYDADVVVIGGDTVEATVAASLSPAQLRTVAWEQFLLAPDIVVQGTGTVADLARELRHGTWFYWWD